MYYGPQSLCTLVYRRGGSYSCPSRLVPQTVTVPVHRVPGGAGTYSLRLCPRRPLKGKSDEFAHLCPVPLRGMRSSFGPINPSGFCGRHKPVKQTKLLKVDIYAVRSLATNPYLTFISQLRRRFLETLNCLKGFLRYFQCFIGVLPDFNTYSFCY